MRLIVKSRRLAEHDNLTREPHIIVSIRNPTSEIPDLALNENTKDTMFLEFDDIDHMPREGSATWYTLNKNPILFSPEMAKQIIEKLKETGVQTVIIHCEAGISRSAGMAAALSKHFNGDDSEYFGGPASMYSTKLYHPNLLVYRTMLDALHEG